MTGRPGAGTIVAVVGAGTMGAGIAQVCLTAGYTVRLFDAEPRALEAARERITDGLDRLVAKERLTPAERTEAASSLVLAPDLESCASGSRFVIEAAAEELATKERIFQGLDEHAPADAILATNTSSLSVEACAAVTRRPERVVGLHFFNPAPLMALVELVVTGRTNETVLDTAAAFIESLGKTPVRCADAPGFIVNRVGRPYLIEAVRLLEAGLGGVAGIDAALEGAGYPMGPFRLIDLIGLDVDLAIDEALHTAFDEAARFLPPALEVALRDEGRLGRKSGHGFYRYGQDRSVTADVAVPVTDDVAPLSDAATVERLELAMINEAYRAVGEGVAAPHDVDAAMRLGAGHPRGPFERVETLGLRHVVERLHELREGADAIAADQYDVAPMLWQMATV